jgi:hypothetical protein
VQEQQSKAMVDLGTAAAFELIYKDPRTHPKGREINEIHGISSLSATGLGNEEVFYRFPDRIEIGQGDNLLPVPIKTSVSKKLKYKAYIGVNYFRNYRMTLNSVHEEIILSNRDSTPDLKKAKSYGIAIYPIDEKWKIIQVYSGDTLLNGIQVMDEVEILGGEPINRFKDICDYKSYLKTLKDNKSDLILKIKGKAKTYQLPFRKIQGRVFS